MWFRTGATVSEEEEEALETEVLVETEILSLEELQEESSWRVYEEK